MFALLQDEISGIFPGMDQFSQVRSGTNDEMHLGISPYKVCIVCTDISRNVFWRYYIRDNHTESGMKYICSKSEIYYLFSNHYCWNSFTKMISVRIIWSRFNRAIFNASFLPASLKALVRKGLGIAERLAKRLWFQANRELITINKVV